ncbi:hypothetical protein [Tropicibacter oceani]|uniref:Uncharacterized protein n=1 Tax=Tropicibacter oceani TaxID=3058420 RepID=A0ABY8QHR4_9RHOB|nr:hypothetical protein [Tropicibacter oceani]WGW03541.1 hypothetical protein QF118_16685 [Tropicibacter oceani]
MQPFTPFTFSATLIRTTGEVWSRNLRCMQVFFDAALRQQMALAGMAHPVAVSASVPAPAKPASKSRARKTPSTPPSYPDMENSDLPV